MLDAFIKKHVRKILARSGTEHSNEKNEDAITSMVFTPLRFMAVEDALNCLKVIFRNEPSGLWSRRASTFSLELWPSGIRGTSHSGAKATRCEPDLVAKLSFDHGRDLVVVGEMKWDSYPSKDELGREVKREQEALRTLNAEADLLTFALVKYLRKDFDKLPCNVLLSWTEFHRRLNESLHFYDQQSACRRWMEDISKFLTLAEQTIFTGITNKYDGVPALGTNPVFYCSGFGGFWASYDEIPKAKGGHYFYARRKR